MQVFVSLTVLSWTRKPSRQREVSKQKCPDAKYQDTDGKVTVFRSPAHALCLSFLGLLHTTLSSLTPEGRGVQTWSSFTSPSTLKQHYSEHGKSGTHIFEAGMKDPAPKTTSWALLQPNPSSSPEEVSFLPLTHSCANPATVASGVHGPDVMLQYLLDTRLDLVVKQGGKDHEVLNRSEQQAMTKREIEMLPLVSYKPLESTP